MANNMIIYTTADGLTKVETTFDQDTVWLTREQMATLFQRDRSVISRHIQKVFSEGELDEKSNVQKMHIAQTEGTPSGVHFLSDKKERINTN